MLFVDLDNFKMVNDSLGHPMGDRVLKQVAARLSGAIPDGGRIARFGGDEFVVVLDDSIEPALVAERIRRSVQQPMTFDGQELIITASIGFAVNTVADLRADDLLRDADAAMYGAKAGGRDRVAGVRGRFTRRPWPTGCARRPNCVGASSAARSFRTSNRSSIWPVVRWSASRCSHGGCIPIGGCCCRGSSSRWPRTPG